MGELFRGDCLEVLREFESDSIDSMVTDPPAGIHFMGKDWDSARGGRNAWVNNMQFIFKECHRVLKPGAHGLVWAIPRTSHWTAWALEEAGFEIRDVVTHLFGSGFPKNLDISKAIDKAAGAKREVIGTVKKTPSAAKCNEGWARPWAEGKTTMDITAPATDAAKQWQGFGTALKPASEFWILVRKPLSEKNVASNVLKWGTGGIAIDPCRIEATSSDDVTRTRHGGFDGKTVYGAGERKEYPATTQGRFPSNLVLSHSPYCTDDQCDIECVIKMLDEQSGTLQSGGVPPRRKGMGYHGGSGNAETVGVGRSEGGASRFFYCAKASKAERNAGCEGMPTKRVFGNNKGDGLGRGISSSHIPNQNFHPTVKPQKLMRYLVRLVTPPKGKVLDPFMGSGSTGVAALSEGFQFIGIEREQEYFEIAQKRTEHVKERGAK